jgi:hypothetical protein
LLPEFLIQGVGYPAVSALNLGGDGELVVFFRQSLAVLFDDPPDGNPPQQGRGYG